MEKKKILVLTDNMPWGHRSIAKAIFNFLKAKEKNDFSVDYVEVGSKFNFIFNIYKLAYRYFPKVWKLNDSLNKLRPVRFLYKRSFNSDIPNLRPVCDKLKPDLIISTYFGHSHALAVLRKRENLKFKLWTVIADPWTSSPIGFVLDCDLSLVYDKKAEDLVVSYGIDRKKVFKTGWWVRPEMYDKFNKLKTKKKLGIKTGCRVIFVGGGSFGNNSIFRILPILDSVRKEVVFIFNSGTDKSAYFLVEQKRKALLEKKSKVEIKNFGWIENMAEILSVCDMVLGKAGPNFLFDCIARRKPFVVITHISGQEDGNLELIKKKKLGWIRETSVGIADFLRKYLNNPAVYEDKYKKEINKEALDNKKSMEIILKKIREELTF